MVSVLLAVSAGSVVTGLILVLLVVSSSESFPTSVTVWSGFGDLVTSSVTDSESVVGCDVSVFFLFFFLLFL